MSAERDEMADRSSGVDEFAFAVRARRNLLQTLFYSTRNSSRDAWAHHLRIEKGNEQEGSVVSNLVLDVMHSWEKSVAEQTAQDAAWALMLIIDYSLQRLGDNDRLSRARLYGHLRLEWPVTLRFVVSIA